MLTIWGRTNSINVQKVLCCCDEIGLPYTRIDAGMAFGINKTDDYLAMNPNGLVPTMSDDGFILWESHAMIRYLCRSYDTEHLITPKDEKTFAKADQWTDWAHTAGWVPMRGLFWGMVRTPPEQRNHAEIAASIEGCAKAFALVDQELIHHAYIAGDAFSFGDIPLALLAHRWFTIDIERPDLPHFQHWYEGIVARPGFAKHGSAALS